MSLRSQEKRLASHIVQLFDVRTSCVYRWNRSGRRVLDELSIYEERIVASNKPMVPTATVFMCACVHHEKAENTSPPHVKYWGWIEGNYVDRKGATMERAPPSCPFFCLLRHFQNKWPIMWLNNTALSFSVDILWDLRKTLTKASYRASSCNEDVWARHLSTSPSWASLLAAVPLQRYFFATLFLAFRSCQNYGGFNGGVFHTALEPGFTV